MKRAIKENDLVVWTRMQAEAGQPLASIFARKERERTAGKGVFCWGVGNAPARAIANLAKANADLEVIFSVMKSRPKLADVKPSGLVVWRSYYDEDGKQSPLPSWCLVTSRASTTARAKSVHYALMCHSNEPLEVGDSGPFDPTAFRNASETGAAVGPSQVTALLRRTTQEQAPSAYRINFRAKLTLGYWAKLGDPLVLTARRRIELNSALSQVKGMSSKRWLELVAEARKGPLREIEQFDQQLSLL